MRGGFLPCFLAGARRSRQQAVQDEEHPQGCGRHRGKDCYQGIAAALYRNVLEGGVYEVSSPAVAEMEKLLENTYRNINIGLANEMAIICNRMGINVWEVIDAAKTKPYGFQAFYPGPGLGGHCIPLDPFYLTWKAREYRLPHPPDRNAPARSIPACRNMWWTAR